MTSVAAQEVAAKNPAFSPEQQEENKERKESKVDLVHPEENENIPKKMSLRTQIIATLVILGCAIAGGITGILLSNFEASAVLVSWIALPGELFIRTLSVVVLPMVFVNIILAVIQMLEAGKAGSVGKYTMLCYLLTTFMAAIEGLIAVLLFKDNFSVVEDEPSESFVRFQCLDGSYMQVLDSGALGCGGEIDDADVNSSVNFELLNTNNYLVTVSEDFEDLSFSQTLQEGIFLKMVPSNIVLEFYNGAFVGVVCFAIVFGIASQSLARKPTTLFDFLSELNDVLIKLITMAIYLTPLGVFSLIAGALGGEPDLAQTFKDIGVLVGACLFGYYTHLLIIYPSIFFIVTRANPYKYMRYLIPAQIFAFACSSSAATLPVTLRCVTETGQVPPTIRDFVLPIGATINMDGTALYFPPAIVYLAMTSGHEDDINAASMFLILLISSIGSAGAAPIPASHLVLLITAFNTIFGESGTPDNFAIIVAIDWFLDRHQVMTNITGDAMVARMVTHLAQLELGEEEVEAETA
eukprot:maker-scaffold_41-snap-gene-1.34-mRNA-1 protein AED:0.00 eAED:0.00 QI:135/1/1/1/1/1/2/155/523